MRTTHTFRATGIDSLESREVLSHLVHPVFQHMTPPARVAHVAVIRPTVPARPVATSPVATPPVTVSTTPPASDIVSEMQNLGQTLTNIYIAFQNGTSSSAIAANFPFVQFQGDMVGVTLTARTSATTLATELQNLGATIITTSTTYQAVQSYVPISQLLTVAQLDQTQYGSAMYKPVVFGPSGSGLAR